MLGIALLFLATLVVQKPLGDAPTQDCVDFNTIELTSTYIDGYCKLYLPPKAFVGGEVRARVRFYDSQDTIEQLLENELTPLQIPVYSSCTYTLESAGSGCTEGAEHTLFCEPARAPPCILSQRAIKLLYVLFHKDIEAILREYSHGVSTVDIHEKRTIAPNHSLGFLDDILTADEVLSVLLSYALSSQYGWLNLKLISFTESSTATTGYWARALSKVPVFDIAGDLFTEVYNVSLTKQVGDDGQFTLKLHITTSTGEDVAELTSQSYRPSYLLPVKKANWTTKSLSDFDTTVAIYIKVQHRTLALFDYFNQPGSGSNRGASCADYANIVGQRCSLFSSGENTCVTVKALTKHTLHTSIAEKPVYLLTSGTDNTNANGDGINEWKQLLTLDSGDLIGLCAYWVSDTPEEETQLETPTPDTDGEDGLVYGVGKAGPSPIMFFLVVLSSVVIASICICIILFSVICCCPFLRAYAIDMRWSPYDFSTEDSLERSVLSNAGTVKEPSDTYISPLISKNISPLLIPRGVIDKKIDVPLKKPRVLPVIPATDKGNAEGCLGSAPYEYTLSNVTNDTIISDPSACNNNASKHHMAPSFHDNIASSIVAQHTTDSLDEPPIEGVCIERSAEGFNPCILLSI